MSAMTRLQASRPRWLAALGVGTGLWLAATVASQALPSALLGLALVGAGFLPVAALQGLLGPLAVRAGLACVGGTLRDAGLTASHRRADAAIGAGVAIAFALVQFLLVIPATGGAMRSDVVANTAQIGESTGGLLAFVALAWAGGLSEELFFRGLLLNGVQRLLGGGRAAGVAAGVAVVLLFGLLHGYQGWAGMVDTAFYGGLVMTLLYLWRGRRLTAPLVAHAGWNTLASVVLWVAY